MLGTDVIDSKGNAHTLYCRDGGVKVTPCGALVLEADIDANGFMQEGHIFAPGQWHEVNVWKEEA